MSGRRVAAALVLVAGLGLAACGIPEDDAARVVAPEDVPFGLLAPGETTLPPAGAPTTTAP